MIFKHFLIFFDHAGRLREITGTRQCCHQRIKGCSSEYRTPKIWEYLITGIFYVQNSNGKKCSKTVNFETGQLNTIRTPGHIQIVILTKVLLKFLFCRCPCIVGFIECEQRHLQAGMFGFTFYLTNKYVQFDEFKFMIQSDNHFWQVILSLLQSLFE